MGYNKRVLSKAVSELGKAKAPAKPKDIITDPAGQWKYPGQKTRIPGSSITMQGVNYPVWAQPNIGPGTMMQPNQDYEFPGADYVDETPMAKKGGTLQSKKYSKNMSATNKLFAKNKLFQNKKSKIFDPNAEFKKGGSKLGPINLDPNPLSHYELNYGFNLPTKQVGGVRGNPWLYTYNQESEDREPGQVIGLGADFQHKSGLHGSTNVELPFFNKNAIGNVYSELGYGKRFKNFDADATLKNYSEPGNKFKPSFTTGIGYNKNLGDHINFGVGANNTMVPGKLFNPGIQAGITYRFQEGGENDDEYMDLTDEEIQAYRDAGYEVDELPEAQEGGYVQHELVKAQKGKTVKPLEITDPNKYAFRKAAYDDSLKIYNIDKKVRDLYKKNASNNVSNNVYFDNARSIIKHEDTIDKIKKGSKVKHDLVNLPGNHDRKDITKGYKKPVQPVVLKQPVSNNTPIKSKNVESKKPLEISDPKEFAFRNKMYADSLTLYNQSLKDKKWLNSQTPIRKYPNGEHLYSGTEWLKHLDSENEKYNKAFYRLEKANKKSPTGKLTRFSATGIIDGKDDPRPMNSYYTDYVNHKKPVQPVTLKKANEPINTTTSNTTTEPVSTLPLRPIQQFISPEQTIIPPRPYVKAVKPSANKGVWSGGSEEQFPTGLNTSDWERKTREYQQQQRANKPIAKAQTGLTISDPKEFAYRNKMYGDSLKLYNAYQMQDKLMGPGNTKTKSDLKWSTKELQEGRKKKMVRGLSYPIADDYQNEKDQFEGGFNSYSARPQDLKLIKYYKSLGFTDKDIMYHSSPDIVSDKIKPIGTYLDGTASSPIYKKPKQPVQFGKNTTPQEETIIQQEKNTVDSLPLLPIKNIQTLNPEFIPQRTIQPKSYSNPNRHGRWSNGSNEQFPKGLNTSDWERKTREYQEQQRGNKTVAQIRKEGGDVESWEDELSDDEIEELRRAGYVVEDLD